LQLAVSAARESTDVAKAKNHESKSWNDTTDCKRCELIYGFAASLRTASIEAAGSSCCQEKHDALNLVDADHLGEFVVPEAELGGKRIAWWSIEAVFVCKMWTSASIGKLRRAKTGVIAGELHVRHLSCLPNSFTSTPHQPDFFASGTCPVAPTSHHSLGVSPRLKTLTIKPAKHRHHVHTRGSRRP